MRRVASRSAGVAVTNALVNTGYVIERYAWDEGDKRGVQWLVYKIADAEQRLLKVCQTRRDAARYLEHAP